MADAKISALPAVATPAAADEFAVNQSGITKKQTRAQVHTLEAGETLDLTAGAVTGLSVPAEDVAAGTFGSGDYVFDGDVSGIATLTAAKLILSAAVSKIVPGATSLSLRNNADDADNLIITDAGHVTVRSGLTIDGHFLFASDNTYDIGASGATRPRDLYLSDGITADGNIRLGGGGLGIFGHISEDEGIDIQVAYSDANTSSRIFWTESNTAPFGFSAIYAGSANPTLGGTAFTLSGNTFYFIRHDNSATGATVFSIPRASGDVTFAGAINLDGHFLFTSDNTFNIGANGANRPRDLTVSNRIKCDHITLGQVFSNEVYIDTVAYITERAAAAGDEAGKGQLWVLDNTPNELWFTDDAGTDHQIAFV